MRRISFFFCLLSLFFLETPGVYSQTKGKKGNYSSDVVQVNYLNEHGVKVTIRLDRKSLKFDEGLAPFEAGNNMYGYVDTEFKVPIPPSLLAAGRFSEGLACVKTQCKRKYSSEDCFGFIDTKGKWAIEPGFKFARGFSEGLAFACESNNQCGYILRSGVFAIRPTYREIHVFDESPDYGAFRSDFREGRAIVCVYSGEQCGFIDNSGKKAVELNHEMKNIYPFYGGLARVRIDKMFGYLDLNGKIAINPQYDLATDFDHGFAVVGQGEKTDGKKKGWIIDKTGKKIVTLPPFSGVRNRRDRGWDLYRDYFEPIDDNKVFPPFARIGFDGKAIRPKATKKDAPIVTGTGASKNGDVNSLDLGDFKIVVGKQYPGDKLLEVIDSHFPNAVFSPDQSIGFAFRGKNYVVRTEKVNYSGSANYKIMSISIR